MKLLLFSILLLNFKSLVAAENPILTDCRSSNYTNSSQNKTNLKAILSSLSINGVQRRESFYNATYGDDPKAVYGFSQCMSAASEDDCRQCLANAIAEILQRCPNGAEATIRYYNCILRYSDRRFFSELDTGTRFYAYNLANVTNASLFNTQLEGLMDGLSSAAASTISKYAVNMTSYGSFQKIYGLAQCTRDLSESDCNSCLKRMIPEIPTCCNGRTGGHVYTVSCNIRYETFPFFDISLSPPPAAAYPTPTGESTNKKPTREAANSGKNNASKTKIIVISIVVLLTIISTMSTWLLIRKKTDRRKSEIRCEEKAETIAEESFSFDLSTLKAATNNFSINNKLSKSVIGPVFKGKLSDGREIAVQRTLKGSGKELEEFRRKVALIAKLHHRNIVSLLGCRMEEQEKMLVYEYMANTSLEKFLFDGIKRAQLNWEKRYRIITGIARGLLYLHEEFKHCIVHRDLKASNILLDQNMNPKIANFDFAWFFCADQTHNDTSCIFGPRGYMAPEYATHGRFSIKSDVFSFGVLVLEIVTGQKNVSFNGDEHATNLLSYAWQHWRDGKSLAIIDRSIANHHSRDEILRCLHIGLLCIQNEATKRPTMSSVVLMLNSNSMTIPIPSRPAYFVHQS